jgi:prophage maintenance system killer protein
MGPEDLYAINQEILGLRTAITPKAVSSCYSSIEYYDTPKLKIASIVRSILKNHYFPDGNKRTALIAFVCLCSLNNIQLRPQSYGKIFETFASSKASVEDIAAKLF